MMKRCTPEDQNVVIGILEFEKYEVPYEIIFMICVRAVVGRNKGSARPDLVMPIVMVARSGMGAATESWLNATSILDQKKGD